MELSRIRELRTELDAERISYGELAEIQEAFATIDPATLPEPAENATAGDMLDELENRATSTILPRTDDETYTRTGLPREATARARKHGAKISPVFTGDEYRVDFPNGSGLTAWSTLGARRFDMATAGRVRSRWAGPDGQLPPGDTLVAALNAFSDAREGNVVTDADRIAYAIRRLDGQLPPGDTLVAALDAFSDAREGNVVTDADRIAYALRRLRLWESNYRANAESQRKRGMSQKALSLTIQGNTMADIIKMLDGTEDNHIRGAR